MARESEKIPTSRVRRTATVATLAASEAVKQFGTRAANVTRGQDASEEAMAKRQLETAKQIVAALGTMKGAAMKLGQVMSFLDVGLVAEEHREEFQRELAKLSDAAPTVSFKQMRKVIEQDLEEPLDEVFERFDPEPIAAASIGQVYRATLTGRARRRGQGPVPGRRGRRAGGHAEPGDDHAAAQADDARRWTSRRSRARSGSGSCEELDYELEAQNQRALARIFAGHPFIVVPERRQLALARARAGERVRRGVGFEEVKGYPQAQRDRVGEIVFRFFLGCMYRHRQFSGDPHPGNFLLLADGRVAFLDFGLFKRMDAGAVEIELAAQRAVVERRRGRRCTSCWRESGFLPEPERVDPEHLLEFIEDAIWWYTTADETLQLTPEIATQVMIESSDPRSRHFREMRHQDMLPEHLLGRRMEMLTLAVLAQLRRARQLAPDRARVDLRRSSR